MVEKDYEIVLVEPSEPPDNMVGSGWHCYVIGEGVNRIRGYRQGDLASVTTSVEEIVLRLNERRIGKRGRVHLDMSHRDKPAKTA